MNFSWPKSLSVSITRKLLATLLVLSGIITTIATIVQLSFDYYVEVRDLKNELSRIESSFKNSVANSLWELNTQQIHTQLEGIIAPAGLVYAEVTSGAKLYATAGTRPEKFHSSQTYALQYKNSGRFIELGQLTVVATSDHIKSKILRKSFLIFAIQFLQTLLISFFIYLVIQNLVTRHLLTISAYMKSFYLKSFPKPLKLNRRLRDFDSLTLESTSSDELDILVSNINSMRQELENSYAKLNQLNTQLENKVEEKTHQLMMQRQHLEYSSKMSALGEMAGGIAHEINTPLAAISGSVQLLLKQMESDLPIEKSQLLKTLQRNQSTVEKIAQIVKGLRTFSRDGGGDPFDEISVKLLVTDTISLCQEKIKNNQIQLSFSVVPENLKMTCRFVQASQVLLNLVNNSFDAISALPEKWIGIDASETEKVTLISVTDSGLGISDVLKEKIFQPFFSTKELGKGTGLGLSISESIMHQHGGRLFLNDQSEHTCFVMEFPKRQRE